MGLRLQVGVVRWEESCRLVEWAFERLMENVGTKALRGHKGDDMFLRGALLLLGHENVRLAR